jgi:hypothetical protein
MGDKTHALANTMRASRAITPEWLGAEAKRMGCALLRKEHRGPGDTIEAAASRLAVRNGIPTSILMQAWNRPPREMKVSRWMQLFAVYWDEIESRAEQRYDDRRAQTAQTHPSLVRLADLVAGRDNPDAAA